MMSSIKTDIGSYQIDLNSFVKEGSADKDINDFDKLTDRDGNHLFIWTYDSVPYYPMPYIMETVPRMSNFPTRKNDVFICAYPASVYRMKYAKLYFRNFYVRLVFLRDVFYKSTDPDYHQLHNRGKFRKKSEMTEQNRNVSNIGMLDADHERYLQEYLPKLRGLQPDVMGEKVYDRDGHFMYGWIYDNISVPTMPAVKQTIPIMRDFKIRKEDIFLCAFPSSGTHWFWEMVCMLFNRKAEYLTGTKEQDMMEFLLPEIFEKRPSPRVLNTHLRPKYLPEKMVKEGKVILIVRNPKDVVVSNYRQTYGLKVLGYEGSFPSFYEMFLEGKIHYGSWFDYINEWMEAKENNPNLMIVSYEEAKKDLPALLSRLSKYLDLENDEDLFQKIAELCSFNSMKANKENAIGQLDIWKKDSGFFRSGKSGTWKNWLTVEQNERMDESLEIKLKSSEISKMYKTS